MHVCLSCTRLFENNEYCVITLLSRRTGMNRVGLAVVGALALAALAGPVGAADLSPRYGAPITKAPMYAPGFNWTGFYVGINGGGAWGTSRWDSTNRFDVNGWLIGGTAGYNWQMGQAV